MTTDALPGVALRIVPPAAEPDVLRTDVAVLAGRTRRGPVGQPVRVGSRTAYEAWFGAAGDLAGSGGRAGSAGSTGPAATPFAARGFFENGGRDLWVIRVDGGGSTASVEWLPGEVLPAGLPHARYLVTATSPGAWGNEIRVRIRHQASSLAGAPALQVRITCPGEAPESFGPFGPAELAARLATSRLVRFVPLGPVEPAARTTGPPQRDWDLRLGPGGSDGAPRAADYRAALELALDLPEPALLAVPDLIQDLWAGPAGPGGAAGPAGLSGPVEPPEITALADLLVDTSALHDRMVVLDAPGAGASDDQVALRAGGPEPAGLSADDTLAWVARLRAAVRERAGDDGPLGCAALYHPRLRVRISPDGADNALATVPSAGHVLGVIARLDVERGAHHTPANAVLLEAIDLDPDLPLRQQIQLFEAGINLVRAFPGRGVQVWGGRTLSGLAADRYIAHRRLRHLLVRAIRRVAAPLVFEVNGRQLRLTLVRGITSVLLAAHRSGALAGDRPEQSFSIICDERNNPPGAPSELLVCDIEVAPAAPMEFIRIRLVLGQDRGLEVLES